MPELPEITAHAERLAATYSGAVLHAFRPLHLTALKTFDPDPRTTHGSGLTRVGHRGKYLTLTFEGDRTYVVHLMQAGRLRPDAKRANKPRGGMARWEFEDGDALLLTEPGTERKAGVWLIDGELERSDPLVGLGPDANQVSRNELAEILQRDTARIHGLLRRQEYVAGIGRLLANEILHCAQISPFSLSTALDDPQIGRLHAAMQSVIGSSIEHERSLGDIGKSADRPNNVHHRVGLACRACEDEIRSVEYRRYTVAYCPTCQTDGKVLADNTTSKFVK